MSEQELDLTSGSRLARNVGWNLLGTSAPLLIAIVAIPLLIEGLGFERFGVLTLAWMVVGYFGLFDLGLGRALTKLVAEKLSRGHDDELPALVGTAILLMTVLGILGGIVVAIFSPWLVGNVLKVPAELQLETLSAFYLLAVSIPIVISATGLRGVLEAHQRFGLVNAVRIPLGMFTFLGPLAVLPFSNSLVPVIAVLVVARLISWLANAILCLRVEPSLRSRMHIQRSMIKPLLSLGGWMTVTNIVGPLMVYMDRFLIGAVVTMTAVAYYATPYEIVTKLWIIPGALMGVMFPAFAATFARDRIRAARLFDRTVSYVFLSLFPVVLIVVTLAHEGITLWLGSGFADNSSVVLQLLAIGVFINSHAHVPSGLVQGAGRPDIMAKLHLIELPGYLLLLWWLVGSYGIIGAAVAWVLRVAVDAFVLFIIARRLLTKVSSWKPNSMVIAGIALIILAFGAMLQSLVAKGFFLVIVLFVFAITAWVVILTAEEKNFIYCKIKAIPILNLQGNTQ